MKLSLALPGMSVQKMPCLDLAVHCALWMIASGQVLPCDALTIKDLEKLPACCSRCEMNLSKFKYSHDHLKNEFCPNDNFTYLIKKKCEGKTNVLAKDPKAI